MKCQACEEGRHSDCGMQTWCDCDDESDGLVPVYFEEEEDDMPHSETCTCDTCIQDHPERDPETWANLDELTNP